jgi:dienelactone hydrolase
VEEAMFIIRSRQCLAVLLFLVILLMAGLPHSALTFTALPNDEAAKLFAYDRATGFDLKEESAKEQDGVALLDINYAAYHQRHGRIRAYLVKPQSTGVPPRAGVLFFHWLGEPKGDRSEFLDEAIALAKRGTVSLLIQGYFPWLEPPTEGRADRQQVIEQTIEVRRALDLLLSQPGVDAKRIGYVGHDYGAMYGAIVAGVDKRVKAYVLMAGMGSFSDWSLKYWPKTAARGEKAYREAVKEVDPIRHISRAAPAALLFQFSNSDIYIPKSTANAFYGAASEPKEVKWYDVEHHLNIEAASRDRRAWLTKQLGLAETMKN